MAENLLFKAASAALRKLPELTEKNAELATKVAYYERKDRVGNIQKEAASKAVNLPQDEDLMKVSEDRLGVIETALKMYTPTGNIKLGEAEPEGTRAEERPGMSDLDRLLLDPHGFMAAGESEQ